MRGQDSLRGTVLGLGTLLATALPSGAAVVVDGGFEATQKAAGFYYNPTDFPAWTFQSTSGVIRPSSGFGGPTTAAEGTQYAFLQTNTVGNAITDGSGGRITQTITIPADGVYKFNLQHAARTTVGLPKYEWILDGNPLGGTQSPTSLAFAPSSFTYAVKAGTHTLTLKSTGPTDTTSFVDAISIDAVPASPNGGSFNRRAFFNDVDSGISSTNTYTHAVNLNGPDVTVNGVLFKGGTQTGANYTLTNAPVAFANNTNDNLTGSVNALAKTFFYNGTETLTLTGLTVGETYTTTFYNVGFGGAGQRLQNVTDSQGGEILNFDQNFTGNGNGNLLQDTYVAQGSSITFTFTPLVAGNTFHQYAFSNQVGAVPEPGTMGLVALAAAGLLARRRRRRQA